VIDLTPAPERSTSEGAWVTLPQRQSIKEYANGRIAPPAWEEASLGTEEIRFAMDNGTTIEGFAYQIADRVK
jgi:hypothetical protein